MTTHSSFSCSDFFFTLRLPLHFLSREVEPFGKRRSFVQSNSWCETRRTSANCRLHQTQVHRHTVSRDKQKKTWMMRYSLHNNKKSSNKQDSCRCCNQTLLKQRRMIMHNDRFTQFLCVPRESMFFLNFFRGYLWKTFLVSIFIMISHKHMSRGQKSEIQKKQKIMEAGSTNSPHLVCLSSSYPLWKKSYIFVCLSSTLKQGMGVKLCTHNKILHKAILHNFGKRTSHLLTSSVLQFPSTRMICSFSSHVIYISDGAHTGNEKKNSWEEKGEGEPILIQTKQYIHMLYVHITYSSYCVHCCTQSRNCLLGHQWKVKLIHFYSFSLYVSLLLLFILLSLSQ